MSKRVIAYGARVDKMAVVISTTRAHGTPREAINLSDKVKVYPTVSDSKFLYSFDAFKIARQIIQEWRAEQTDMDSTTNDILITAQDPFEAGLAAVWASRMSGAKLQLQIHTDFLSPAFSQESFLNRIRVFIAHKIIPHADNIRVVSERIKQSIADKRITTKNTISVLPIYVHKEQIEKELSAPFETPEVFNKFSQTVLMVSRLEKEKCIEDGIRAFHSLLQSQSKEQAAKTGLIIVGDGNARSKLQALVKELSITDNVEFVGWQNGLASYYRSATVFLQTSSYEGYGMSLVEAALYNRPIVTTNVGIAGFVLKNSVSALITNIHNINQQKEALTELFNNADLRNRLVTEARNAIEHNILSSEEAYINEYIRLWEDCFRG